MALSRNLQKPSKKGDLGLTFSIMREGRVAMQAAAQEDFPIRQYFLSHEYMQYDDEPAFLLWP